MFIADIQLNNRYQYNHTSQRRKWSWSTM